MLGSQGVETVEHDELDIVVGLLDDELGKGSSGSCMISQV